MTKNRRFNPFLRACALITAWAMAFTLITPPPQAFAKNTFELPVPGTMVTTSDGFVPPMLRGLPQEVQDSLAAEVTYPKRLGDPAEYAALARFIVECGYLNGEVIRLDGALRMR